MKYFFLLTSLLLLAACGSGGNLDAVTPVQANIRGTYQLAYTNVDVTAPGTNGQVSHFVSYSTGILRLFDNSTYTRTTQAGPTQSTTLGYYLFADSTSSILGSRNGTFLFTPSSLTVVPGTAPTGVYGVTPDFTLTLYYQYSLPDNSTVTRSNVWVKESDSPRFSP